MKMRPWWHEIFLLITLKCCAVSPLSLGPARMLGCRGWNSGQPLWPALVAGMSTAACPSKYLLQAGWSELELETTGWHPHTLRMDKRNIFFAVLLIIQVLCKKYTDSVCVCMYGPYLYDLLQGTQPRKAMLLKQITGAFLHKHGEQTEPLKPECK